MSRQVEILIFCGVVAAAAAAFAYRPGVAAYSMEARYSGLKINLAWTWRVLLPLHLEKGQKVYAAYNVSGEGRATVTLVPTSPLKRLLVGPIFQNVAGSAGTAVLTAPRTGYYWVNSEIWRGQDPECVRDKSGGSALWRVATCPAVPGMISTTWYIQS